MERYLLSALLYMSISVGSERMWKETWIYNESYEVTGILSHQVDETTFQTTLLKSLVTRVLFTSVRPTNFSNNHARFSITVYSMRERYNDEKVFSLVQRIATDTIKVLRALSIQIIFQYIPHLLKSFEQLISSASLILSLWVNANFNISKTTIIWLMTLK